MSRDTKWRRFDAWYKNSIILGRGPSMPPSSSALSDPVGGVSSVSNEVVAEHDEAGYWEPRISAIRSGRLWMSLAVDFDQLERAALGLARRSEALDAGMSCLLPATICACRRAPQQQRYWPAELSRKRRLVFSFQLSTSRTRSMPWSSDMTSTRLTLLTAREPASVRLAQRKVVGAGEVGTGASRRCAARSRSRRCERKVVPATRRRPQRRRAPGLWTFCGDLDFDLAK